VVGAILGAALGAIMHGAMGGRRDFVSVSRTEAERYEVMADDEVAEEAERLLEVLPARAPEPRAGAGVFNHWADARRAVGPLSREVMPSPGRREPHAVLRVAALHRAPAASVSMLSRLSSRRIR
jgi:hypothetical protein